MEGWRALVVLATVALAGTALANEDIDTELARKHFQRGSELYASGDYAAALDEFKQAQLIKPLPAMQFNLARCYDRLERRAEAIAEYRAYLASG